LDNLQKINDKWINWQNQIDRYLPRLTGSEKHQQMIEWLKNKIEEMDYNVMEDEYRFRRMEEKESGLWIVGKNEKSIPISSIYPYSGKTDTGGIEGELVFCSRGNLRKAAGKIAVITVKRIALPTALLMDQRESLPAGRKMSKWNNNPLLASILCTPNLKKAKDYGILGIILIWEGMSEELAKDQVLPFTKEYQGLPAVWVHKNQKTALKRAEQQKKKVRLLLDATCVKNVPTKTLTVRVEGENNNENIIINTHTDGTNSVEENGATALLAMLQHYRNRKPKRNLIFVFVSGHFQIPQIGVKERQATSRWLAMHNDLWDGKNGHEVTVAALTIEHLGCLTWADNLTPEATNKRKMETELVYTGNSFLSGLYLDVARSYRRYIDTFIVKAKNNLFFGEGQPLFQEGIPIIAFLTTPEGLCKLPCAQMETDKNLLIDQIFTFIKLLERLETTPARLFGDNEKQHYGL
jgi:hypothetical protein